MKYLPQLLKKITGSNWSKKHLSRSVYYMNVLTKVYKELQYNA